MIYLLIYILFAINIGQFLYFRNKLKELPPPVQTTPVQTISAPIETNRSFFSILYGSK